MWLGWRDRKWRRADEAAAEAERADRRAAQAPLITTNPEFPMGDQSICDYAVLCVHNGSTDPIFDIEIMGITDLDDGVEYGWRVCRTSHMGDDFPVEWPLIAAGERRRMPIEFTEGGEFRTVPFGFDVEVAYTDVNGLWWTRTGTAPPKRQIFPTNPPPPP